MALKIAATQLNPTLGDLEGNSGKILDFYRKCTDVDLIVTSESSLTAYPLEDLATNRGFVRAAMAAAESLAKQITGAAGIIVGCPWIDGDKIYNAALLMEQGKIIAKTYKHDLPNYGVYDEARIYAPGPLPKPASFRRHQLGIMVCEDLWHSEVSKNLKSLGAEILIAINGSVWFDTQRESRMIQSSHRVKETGLPLIYANQLGGQDEVVFDGSCFALNKRGEVVAKTRRWIEDYCSVKLDNGDLQMLRSNDGDDSEDANIYNALVLGTRDYVNKNNFPGVLLGLSGGIDSALVAAIAVDALGKDRARAYMLPSPYTSAESKEDADDVARMLGIKLETISIEPGMQAIQKMVSVDGLAAENVQSRLRGLALMALSNQTGWMLLTTGNKSEMAAGYATLYGDMCGGFNPLKDVYKTKVFALSRYRNARDGRPVMPERVITKAPSAELRPNQKDQDSLPPYDILDKVLYNLIEKDLSINEIVAAGFDRQTVEKTAQLLDRAEYKRRQGAPGVKISTRAFGRDRRYPITNKYKRTEN